MQIYILIADDRQGPFTPEQITEKIKAGECTVETLAWKDGMEEWQPLKDVCPEPAEPPPLLETPASELITLTGKRASQRSRMKPRHLNGLAGGCFVFCFGAVMCFLAFLLCLTGIGALLGVPLFIAGMGIAYVAAPAVGVALGIGNKAERVARGPRPSTTTEPDSEDETSALPQPAAPPPLPETTAAMPATAAGGSNAFVDFFRAYRGMFRRIKSSPLPQPAQWYDRYPIIFPAAFLAFFFFGLGLIPLLLTSRLSGGDKGRVSLIAAWPLYLAALPVTWPLLVLLILLLPVVALVMMWVKKWFTPNVRYIVTAVMGLGFVCFVFVGVVAVVGAMKDSGSKYEPEASNSIKPYKGMSTGERDAMEAQMEKEAVRIASSAFGGRDYVLGAEAAMYSEEAGGRFPLVVYVTKDYLMRFSDLGSQRKDIVQDLKRFFGWVKESGSFEGVKNVFLVYGAGEFFDVYNNVKQTVPAGVLEFMLPMSTVEATNWSAITNDDTDRLFNEAGHFKVYAD